MDRGTTESGWISIRCVRRISLSLTSQRPGMGTERGHEAPAAVGRPVAYASAHVAPHAGGTLGLYPGVARRRASADPDSHLPAARLHLAAGEGRGQRSPAGLP